MINLPLPVMLLLIVTPIAIAVGQVLFKISSSRLSGDVSQQFFGLILDPIFVAAIFIYSAATLLWIYVLKAVPLTQAYSFMAMTFVAVPILAYFFLGEQINIRYVIGSVLIISGLLIANT
jgi:undecaprenyl phosphate-alpha-L-ara4N flippase subunit ArnE